MSTVLDPLRRKDAEVVTTTGHPVKSFRATEVKASKDEPGRFTALVSVFGNVDSVRDRVMPGAFAKTLEEDGLPPLVWSHQWGIPPIGKTNDAKETDEGLLIDATLFVDPADGHDLARQINAGLREGSLNQFSFAYDVIAARYVEEDGIGEVRELEELKLIEVGPCLLGANEATRVIAPPKSIALAIDGLDAKGWDELLTELKHGDKAGARNSTKDAERLQTIHDLAVENGAACEPDTEDEGKSRSGDEHPDTAAARDLMFAFPQ